MHQIKLTFIVVVVGLLSVHSFAAVPSTRALIAVDKAVKSLIAEQSIVGAQLMIGHGDQLLMGRNYGFRSVTDATPVDSETLFCIGSCSKPIASAVIMALADQEKLVLDKPIDKWLPEFGALKTRDGDPSRAPTMIELLSHHGGIYSQKNRMTRRQTGWIRNFKLTLEDSVDGIAGEPLIAEPGLKYAYSGAGYCVVGRVAEVAAESSFEKLLQEFVCEPLGLNHTTYFPRRCNANIASGSLDKTPHPATPHLSEPFQLPLIGGSLYSTAEDSARFLQLVLAAANGESETLMSQEQFREYSSQYSEKKPYALGWSLMMNDGETYGLGHSGALASSRAVFRVNLKNGVYVAVLYTLSDPSKSTEVGRSIVQAAGLVTAHQE